MFIALHDNDGKPWISLIQGETGFINSPDSKTLNIQGSIVAQDQLGLNIQQDEAVGILGLDMGTRRRNRLNGSVKHSEGSQYLSINVEHSFGNCPKYIQLRSFAKANEPPSTETTLNSDHDSFEEFGDHDINLIQTSDTLFIATAQQPFADLDASHRGGKPGFIKINSNKELWFSDYPGNNFFQTFGNIYNYPFTGLMLIDFKTGDLLLMCGQSRLEQTSHKENDAKFIPRRVLFTLEKGIRIKQAIKGQWSNVEMSPFLDKIEDR